MTEDVDSLGAGTLAGGSSSESDSSLLELLSFNLPVGAAGGFAGPYMMKCHFTNCQKSHVQPINFSLQCEHDLTREIKYFEVFFFLP